MSIKKPNSMITQLITVGLALLLMTGATTYLSFSNLRAQLQDSLWAQSAMIAANIAPALQFSDVQTADDILRSLSNNKDIMRVALFNEHQEMVVGWKLRNDQVTPIIDTQYLTAQKDHDQIIHQSVIVASQHKGELMIEYSLASIYGRIIVFASGTLVAIVLTLLTAFFLLRRVDNVQRKKQEIETVHKHTKDSIEYASLIQHALIPEAALFQHFFRDALCLWMPKDIVGGDIYSFTALRHDDEALLMVIDCTGHGVPGAFVTMLVKAIEQQIVANIMHSTKPVSPSEILTIFNQTLKRILKQETDASIHNAGFDGAIVYYNKQTNLISYAGANTPLFYIDNDELKVIKGDRHSVGYKRSKSDFSFKEYEIEAKEGMSFYISTDGYLDQTGGEQGFLFGKTRLGNLFMQHRHEPMAQQKTHLIDAFKAYQGNEAQNDDLTIIGFKV